MLWPHQVEEHVKGLLRGNSLHVCCGLSKLGNIRLDNDPAVGPDILGDAAKLPFKDDAFDTVLCDPPYNYKYQWNHDMLSEIVRVASQRVIFQHWFVPVNNQGWFKKEIGIWAMTSAYIWLPKTYFGRANVISIFDNVKYETSKT